MKKILALFLSGIVILGAFSGCSLIQLPLGNNTVTTETTATEKETVDQQELEEAFALKVEELKGDFTIFERQQKGNMKSAETSWFGAKGVMCGVVVDLDLDGQDEMAVFYTDVADAYQLDYNIFMSVYEYVEGMVNLADDMLFDAYINTEYITSPQGFLWNSKMWKEENLLVSTKAVGDKNYIICEHSRVSNTFDKGQNHNYWLLSYSDGELCYEGSYTQTQGEVAGFEYTGYEIEYGVESDATVYYGEGRSKAKYDDYEDAVSAYFKKFGLKVRDDYKQFDAGKSIFKSQGVTKLLEFTNKSKQNTWDYSYDYSATLKPNSKLEP